MTLANPMNGQEGDAMVLSHADPLGAPATSV